MTVAFGIAASEYAARRRDLMATLGPGAVALVPAAEERLRNGSNPYPFRQDSDFLYLTGFTEPQALLVLVPGRQQGEALLFCRERDPQAERFDGERLGPERAAGALGLDDAFPWDDLDDIVPGLLEGATRLYLKLGADIQLDRRARAWRDDLHTRVDGGALPHAELADLGHLLHEQRLIKSPAEIALMREAGRLSAQAHCQAMRSARPGCTEADLEARLRYVCHRGGAREQAYAPIVAAGGNACTLHYIRNDGVLKAGEMVLIDAGCEFHGYAADITRTFPVDGRFTSLQRDWYELVLAAQAAAIAAVRPGAHFNAPHEAAQRVFTEGLLARQLLQGDFETLMVEEAARRFTLHKCSHWLGLDVHDVGHYQQDGQWRQLEPGMVLTIEPGIYFPADVADVPAHLTGLGIRIEDDVLVTAEGHEVLTQGVPREPEAIEALMAERQ